MIEIELVIIQYHPTETSPVTIGFVGKFLQIFKEKITLVSRKLFQTMEEVRTPLFSFHESSMTFIAELTRT